MSRRPPDDVAQVVLRALLAWPALGVMAVALTPAIVDQQVPGALLPFGAGAGLGAGLVAASAGLVGLLLTRLLRGRSPWPPLVELGLLALLVPLALLGGTFAAGLVATGSSRDATVALVASHLGAPLDLLDLDASLAFVAVAAGAVLGRARGWRPRTQAAVGVALCLPALALRLALGGLDRAPLRLLVAVELALAAAGPFVVAAADRAVGQARLLLAGLTRPGGGLRLHLLATCGLAPAVVACAVGGLLSWPGRPRSPLAGLFVLCALLTPAPYLVVRARMSRRRGLALDRAGLAAAAVLVVAPIAAFGLTRLVPATTGLQLRAATVVALGLDPVPVAHEVEDASRRGPGPWELPGLTLPSPGLADAAFVELLQAAADQGDLRACRVVTSPLCARNSPYKSKVRWLRRLVAAGDLAGAERALSARGEAADVAAAAEVILGAAKRGDLAAGPSLTSIVFQFRKDHARWQARVDAVLEADPARWIGFYADHFRGGCCAPGAPEPLTRWVLERSRFGLPTPNLGGRSPSELLLSTLSRRPDLARAGDGRLVSSATPIGKAWPPLLLGLEPGPLDPERAPALAAAARGDWAAVWSGSRSDAEAFPGDRDAHRRQSYALRARAHALLDEARRTSGSRDGALHLARAQLERASVRSEEVDAAEAFDDALLAVHETAEGCRTSDPARLLASIDAVLALAPGDAEVARRVESLRRATIDALGAPEAADLLRLRRARADQLRKRGDEAAASRLEAMP